MKRIPCRKCARTSRPLFIECELEKLEHGLTSYVDVRPMLLRVLANVKPIDYKDCADAMLKMWMENVLTDGEYNKIMDKLNKAHIEGRL